MNKNFNFLAFDLGATSGRAILAKFENGEFEMKDIYRFPNAVMELHGKFYWNIFQLYDHLKQALIVCAKSGEKIDSIGIDTWGVDFGYIAADGTILSMPRAYRDPYTDGAPEAFFDIVSREEVYSKTGIQVMNFNTLYQLFAAKKEEFSPLTKAEKILFIPDLLSYMLTGNMVCEYTDASTSQILNPSTKMFETSLLEAAGISPSLLGAIVEPGSEVGYLTDALAEETGVGKVRVVTVAGHDTASAIVAVPADDKNFAYLSSGTWSLMGIETENPILTQESYAKNFTNEGGVEGTTRFLKNITGMWILEQCRKEWSKQGKEFDYVEIVKMSIDGESFGSLIAPDDPSFANPQSMLKAIDEYLAASGQPTPQSDAEVVYCIFNSLANRYREVLDMLQAMSPFKIEKLYVIGGGVRNERLNQMTADAIGIPVVGGPAEATAIGNVMIQAKAAGLYADRWEIRSAVAKSLESKIYMPTK